MGIFTAFDITASGLTAQRYRMDVIAENVANANTTRTADGTPYRRKIVTFTTQDTNNGSAFAHVLDGIVGEGRTKRDHHSMAISEGQIGYGVKITEVAEDDKTPMNMVYDPAHPDADENGYVTYPNVNMITEMTNLIDASRAYEANATMFDASKAIVNKGIDLMISN